MEFLDVFDISIMDNNSNNNTFQYFTTVENDSITTTTTTTASSVVTMALSSAFDLYTSFTTSTDKDNINSSSNNNSSSSSPNASNNHNMTHQELLDYLESLQREELLVYLPALCLILLFSVLGLVGNLLVLIVYKSKFHRTPTRIFIMTIAIFDLISNTICIPGDAYDMFNLYMYPFPVLCRLFRYSNASTTITSAFILLALSVTRYKKICRPFGKQINSRHAKIASVSCAIFAWTVSIPFGILNGIHSIPTPRPGVFGYECSIADRYVDTIWPLANSGLFLLLFLGMCGPLVVLYTLIGIKAFKHSKMHGTPMVNVKSTATATMSLTDDNLGNNNPGVLAKLFAWNKKKRYGITTNSRTIDSCDSDGDAAPKQCAERERSGKSERVDAKKKGKETMSDRDKEEETLSVKFVRSLSENKTAVNFSMVRELTSKLKVIKQTDDAPSTSGQNETKTENDVPNSTNTKESFSDEEALADPNEKTVEFNLGNASTKHSSNDTNDREATEECLSSDNGPGQQGTAVAEDQKASETQSTGNKGLASSLSWIDVAYSLHEDRKKSMPDKDSNGTPNKKSSLSRKVSRENSLLQKHRRIREALLEKLKINTHTDDDDESSCDETGGKGNEKDETNAFQQNKSKRNSLTHGAARVDVSNKQYDSGAEESGATKTNKRSSVINRTTAMLILITSFYVLSYVPYLVLVFFRQTQPDNFEAMGKTSQAIHHLFLRTYFANSAANAIIYSLCDKKFKKEALKIFRCRR